MSPKTAAALVIKRAVTLGDGRKVSLAAYVAAWKKCLALHPSTPVGRCPDGWDGRASDALAQFRSGMHDRINRHLPHYGKGRKWSSDWQRETMQAAARLNCPRLAIDWLPIHLKERFSHRLRSRAA
ncbi:MAG: hypothetical protein EOS20_17280 [Mesorhizobium sp.]|uniref:hypothetical protein n=1 Tax=Mesorhizobium sp. TaxID=1871066 RepID=UPI000FE64BAE|nr:hypothetical protein [Mesorhizobium sp.]RWQ35826.1 MAG: hypothetical protein EOS20_17280 [Mesorhizobium sp.]